MSKTIRNEEATPPVALRRLSLAAAASALLYGAYRAYYGFGGTVGMFGTPSSEATWRTINLVAAGLLLAAAVLPIVVLGLWRQRLARHLLLGVAWIIAVGCVGHALVDDVTRVFSLAGVLDITYPAGFWLTLDHRAADLQDLLFNETWFLIEGLLWAAIAWTVLGPSRARIWWIASAAVAVAIFVAAGLLSAFGTIGRTVVL